MDFVAIDFEKSNNNSTSACSIGLVKVVNDEIVDDFYTLMKPVPDEDGWMWEYHEEIHHISEEMVANKPTWDRIWPFIEHYFESDNVFCHGISTDKAVFNALNRHYGIKTASYTFYDTNKPTRKKLVDACKKYGIDFGEEEHHNALADARACALLALAILKENPDAFVKKKTVKAKQEYSDGEILNKSTMFYQKRVVVTGTFRAYHDREELKDFLRSLGARVTDKISNVTDFVIYGDDAGPSKMAQVEEMRAKGGRIRAIGQDEFEGLMSIGLVESDCNIQNPNLICTQSIVKPVQTDCDHKTQRAIRRAAERATDDAERANRRAYDEAAFAKNKSNNRVPMPLSYKLESERPLSSSELVADSLASTLSTVLTPKPDVDKAEIEERAKRIAAVRRKRKMEKCVDITFKVLLGITVIAGVVAIFICGIGMIFFFLPLLKGAFKK